MALDIPKEERNNIVMPLLHAKHIAIYLSHESQFNQEGLQCQEAIERLVTKVQGEWADGTPKRN